MCRKWAIGLSVLATALLWASSATAGILVDDPNGDGMPAWQGRHAYRPDPNYPACLAVDVEYCVYAPSSNPGIVPSPFERSFGTDPSGGAHYVYAYQAFNDLDPHPYPPVKYALTRFSVSLDDDEEADNIGYLPGTGDLGPYSSELDVGTAGWTFDPTLGYGYVSDVLFFTSPYGPEWDEGSVSGGMSASDPDSMPTPAPEPGTLALIALAAGLAFWRGQRRHNS